MSYFEISSKKIIGEINFLKKVKRIFKSTSSESRLKSKEIKHLNQTVEKECNTEHVVKIKTAFFYRI